MQWFITETYLELGAYEIRTPLTFNNEVERTNILSRFFLWKICCV